MAIFHCVVDSTSAKIERNGENVAPSCLRQFSLPSNKGRTSKIHLRKSTFACSLDRDGSNLVTVNLNRPNEWDVGVHWAQEISPQLEMPFMPAKINVPISGK